MLQRPGFSDLLARISHQIPAASAHCTSSRAGLASRASLLDIASTLPASLGTTCTRIWRTIVALATWIW